MSITAERNSPTALLEWAKKSLEDSTLSPEERHHALVKANDIIAKGGWRGNISDAWKGLGYTTAEIPDLYV